jgi:quercetin dioxygenase-like cupin family protein
MLSLPDGLLVQCPQVGSGETFIKEMILDRAANELGVKDRHQSDVECRLPLGESVKRGLAVAWRRRIRQYRMGASQQPRGFFDIFLISRCRCIHVWEEVMSTLVGFGTFAALVEEQISEKISRRILSGDQGMVVWWSIEAGVHVEPHSHTNEQIVWMLKGKMDFRLGSEQRVCGQGDVVVIPGGTEHEAWFREDTEVIDFFAPPRDDFLLGGKPAYMSEG